MNTNLKLKFYYDHVLGTVYDEGESPMHRALTERMVRDYVDPLKLNKDSRILDLGCGPGYFLDEMAKRGYTNMLGITLSNEDVTICQKKDYSVERRDMNFLTEKDESVDFLFCRHSLEHSPFPYITLLEYNRVLKPNALMYIEVPQPDCELNHEANKNHFSILGKSMWLSLLTRTGFDVTWYDVSYGVTFNDQRGDKTENYYVFVCQRKRPVDIK